MTTRGSVPQESSGFPDRRVLERLRSAPSGAVVLERVAYGAGVVNWYVCAGEAEFHVIAGELSLGSVVSFYFDDRISRRDYTPDLRAEMLAVMEQTGDTYKSGSLQETEFTWIWR